MANSISLAQKYSPLLDEIYQQASKTAILDGNLGEWVNYDTVNFPKITMSGLANYDRNTGYVQGDVTVTYEQKVLNSDRGRKFIIDVMDDNETIGIAYGRLAGEFTRTQVVPENDARRFAKYFVEGTNQVEADLTDATALDAVDIGIQTLEDANVDLGSVVLFVSNEIYRLIKNSDNFTRRFDIDKEGMKTIDKRFMTLEGMPVVKVPRNRFYTAIDLFDGITAGQEAGGYQKGTVPIGGTLGKDLNFQMIDKLSVIQGIKHYPKHVIAPEFNPNSDGWIVKHRVYQIADVFDNKRDGIYSHNKTI